MSVCNSGDVKLDAAVNAWLKHDKVNRIFCFKTERPGMTSANERDLSRVL